MNQDTQTLMGKILDPHKEYTRDAVHIALAPVIAGQDLIPGQRVGLDEQGRAGVIFGGDVGIVDPFLNDTVRKGQKFFIYLFPNTVTGMVHHWSHPAFSDERMPDAIDHVAYICHITRDELLEHADEYVEDGGSDRFFHIHMGDNEYYNDVSGNDWTEFWKEYKTLRGLTELPKHITDGDYGNRIPFSCAC